MKKYLLKACLLWLTGYSILLTACDTNPTRPGNPAPSPTITPTATPAVFWYSGWANRDSTSGSPTVSKAELNLQVNGNLYDTAEVVLTGTNISTPVTLSYTGGVTIPGTGWVGTYDVTGGWTYQVGESYTLTCIAMGVTTSATLSAPGNITFSEDPSGAVTFASWTTEGNSDFVEVYNLSTFSRTYYDGPNLNSPVTIDPLAPYTGPGNYETVVMSENFTTSVSNAVTGSAYSVRDDVVQYCTK